MILTKEKVKIADPLFILWGGGSVFVAYFLVYALRKAFTASTFDGLELLGIDYKIVLSVSQIIGYLLSKFMGIKIISELKRKNRFFAITGSAVIAELSLVLFGLIPYPYNFFCLFFNGLALGSMWGFLFSYIEGRRLTDILASFLGVSMVVSSGAAKSFGLFFLSLGINEFWMPAIIGGIALPLLIGIACLLDKLPEPTKKEKIEKSERIPLRRKQRSALWKEYSMVLIPLLTVNILYTVLRDIKEDFLVDILSTTNMNLTSFLFVRVDAIVTIILLVVLGSLIRVHNNQKAIHILLSIMFCGSIIILFTTFLFKVGNLSPLIWLFMQSMGIYSAYLAFQTVFFDRFIAFFRIAGNVGFFIYLSDFLGYLASCIFLLVKSLNFFPSDWLEYYHSLSIGISIMSMVAITLTAFMLQQKRSRKTSLITETI